jgi:hypothetical protein
MYAAVVLLMMGAKAPETCRANIVKKEIKTIVYI